MHRLMLVGAAVVGFSSAAEAALFLLPAKGTLEASGTTLTVAGVEAEPEAEWFFTRSLGKQQNHSAVVVREGRITLGASDADLEVVGLDAKPVYRDVAKERIADLLTRAGVPLPAGDVVKVKEYQSAKTILRRGAGELRPSEVAFAKSGQRGEVRPLVDPTTAKVGTDVPIVVYIDGVNTSGIAVTATHVAAGVTQQLVSGRAGQTHVRLTHAGEWRLEMAHVLANDPMAPDGQAPTPRVDAVLRTGTLVFLVP